MALVELSRALMSLVAIAVEANAPGRFNHTTEQVPGERPTNTARFHPSGVVRGDNSSSP